MKTPKREPVFLGIVPLKEIDIKYEARKPKVANSSDTMRGAIPAESQVQTLATWGLAWPCLRGLWNPWSAAGQALWMVTKESAHFPFSNAFHSGWSHLQQ